MKLKTIKLFFLLLLILSLLISQVMAHEATCTYEEEETTEMQSDIYLTFMLGGIAVAGFVIIILVIMLFSMKRKGL